MSLATFMIYVIIMCMTGFRVKKSVKENKSNSISFEKAILNLKIFHHSPTIFGFL